MWRSHHCAELRSTHIDQMVTLCGWVHCIRDKGKLIWIDIRDRYGKTQLLLEEESSPHLFEQVRGLGREYVVKAVGRVVKRSAANPLLATGAIEVLLEHLLVLNSAAVPPFLLEEKSDGGVLLRSKLRYLDLRRPIMQRNLLLVHQVMQSIRNHLVEQSFIEIETPLLVKSTPEGARDFVVPSRLYKNHYYALPQSPQLFKQMLMIGGMDRYFQLARCFRDEGFRSDRQPEFTQIDAELSFVTQEQIRAIFEGAVRMLFETIAGVALPSFPILTYKEAMEFYGSDRPDLRFGMAFHCLEAWAKESRIDFLCNATVVRSIVVKGGAAFISRKQISQWSQGWKIDFPTLMGPFFLRYDGQEWKSSLGNKLGRVQRIELIAQLKMEREDLLLGAAGGSLSDVLAALGQLRLEVGKMLPSFNDLAVAPLWVIDFPLFDWSEEENRYKAIHHPFTAPKEEDVPLLTTAPDQVRAQSYDMVINGVEVGGGSIRNHQRAMQESLFGLLGFAKEEMEQQFGFLLKALSYGAPPHGGIALGLGRLCTLLSQNPEATLRDFIAFPKNSVARDIMLEAPAPITTSQQKELGIEIN